MFCPKCGTQNAGTNKFCRKCGKPMPQLNAAQLRVNYSPSPDYTGQTFDGRYRIDGKLGSGGMGDVYRVTRLLMGDTVAMKILHAHLARDPQAAERFRREAATATKLRHRNVVGIYDVGMSATHHVPYILMELAEGYTLRQLIQQHRIMPLDFAVTVTTQVCAALDEAHNLGIIHRDIKPENIVAHQTANGWHVKILDFGISKLYNQADIGLTQDGNAMGTPQYMSPEQCLGEDLDARSDIYSVGIMLYEMLAGCVPFKAAAASAVAVYQVQTAPVPPSAHNPAIHADVERVVMRSLEKGREARQQKASQLAQELIAAATTAFKSGFTTLPSAPVLAPDASPEFQKDDVASDATESEPEDISIVVEDAKHRIDEILTEQKDSPPAEAEPEFTVNTVDDESAHDEKLIETRTEVSTATIVPSDESQSDAEKKEKPVEKKSARKKTERRNKTPAAAAKPAETIVPPSPASPPDFASNIEGESFSLHRMKMVFIAVAAVALLFITTVVAVYFGGFSGGTEANTATAHATTSEPIAPTGMAYVPGGEFMMGSDSGDEHSRPAHNVTVKPFYMDITEVTNEEYKKFVDATKHSTPHDWKNRTFPDGKSKFPVTGVNWDDANAYANWAGKRLPTEDEWEFAARGTNGSIYPWGNEWKSEFANADNQTKGTREVGQGGGKSPFGMLDMVGNAWEWTVGDLVAYQSGKRLRQSSGKKVIRGGSFESRPNQATTTFRVGYPARGDDYSNTGFRCVKDIRTTSQ